MCHPIPISPHPNDMREGAEKKIGRESDEKPNQDLTHSTPVQSGILYNGMGDSIVINPAKWVSSGRRLELERPAFPWQNNLDVI